MKNHIYLYMTTDGEVWEKKYRFCRTKFCWKRKCDAKSALRHLQDRKDLSDIPEKLWLIELDVTNPLNITSHVVECITDVHNYIRTGEVENEHG